MPVLLMFWAAPPWVVTWLTPIWLLGMGALVGLAVLLVLWGVTFLVSRKAGRLVPSTVTEGPLLPILVVTVLLASFGVIGLLIVRNPQGFLESLRRLPSAGITERTFTIEPGSKAAELADQTPQKIKVDFRRDELRQLQLFSRVNVRVSAYDQLLTETVPRFDVHGGEPFEWKVGESTAEPFPDERITTLYVWNSDDAKPTTLRLTATTAPVYEQVRAIPAMAIIVVAIFGLYFLQRLAMPKISAVALATTKSEMAQPLFLICMVLGAFFLVLFIYVPYNTFGEDIKMLKDSGLTLIMVLSIITCLWAASNSISEEIEGRTALTVLSKPIGRRQFILGKFTGIVWLAAVMFLLLGMWFLIMVAFKPIYDARETANTDPNWQLTYSEMVQTAPGLALGFMETVVLAAISVAISTRLPMLANFIICVSIYALGHLTPLLVKSATVVEAFEPVTFIARILATVLPVLEHFDIKPAIAGGQPVPLDYLGWALLYCVLYSTLAMLLALTLFEDRDLA
jgi:ABC-type transport system involved in multi-copper enzyme maturation permease subunit